MSVTEELLSFVDLTSNMLVAQEVYFKSRDEIDKRRWVRLKYQVEQQCREIHRDYRGLPPGNGETQRMF